MITNLKARSKKLRLDKFALFGQLGYQPHAAQLAVHRSCAPRRVLVAGVRSGKSLCAAMEALAAAMSPANSSLGWIVAPSSALTDLIFEQVRMVIEEKLAHRIMRIEPRARVIVLRNLLGGVSEIRGRSAENPNNLLGAALDTLIVDEAAALREGVWENYLCGRLVERHGTALLVSTPRGWGWFSELFERGQDDRDPEFESWQMPSWSNPLIDPSAIELERGRIPPEVFAEEYGAEFVGPRGAACSACGWPELQGAELTIVFDDAEPNECEACGRLLDEQCRPIGTPAEVRMVDFSR